MAKDQSTGAMTQVSWEECAGEELVAAAYFVYGAIAPSASPSTYPEGRLYLERSIAALNAAAGTEFPEQLANVSGDMTTNPPPAFYSREVSAMAAFQDRLVMVCAGGAVSASQPGDYLNFFRTSMLTSLPRDPVNFTIIGGEGDTVRHAVKYDRNLLRADPSHCLCQRCVRVNRDHDRAVCRDRSREDRVLGNLALLRDQTKPLRAAKSVLTYAHRGVDTVDLPRRLRGEQVVRPHEEADRRDGDRAERDRTVPEEPLAAVHRRQSQPRLCCAVYR